MTGPATPAVLAPKARLALPEEKVEPLHRGDAPLPVMPAGIDGKTAAPAGWRNPLGIVALFLGSLAMVAAQISAVDFLAIPLAGAALILGLVGLLAALDGPRTGLIMPASASVLGMGLIGVIWLGPTLLSIDPRRHAAPVLEEDPRLYEIPFDKQSGSRREIGAAEWVDASKNYVQHGPVRVSVARNDLRRLRVAVQTVKPKTADSREASGLPRLVIRLRIVQVHNGPQVRYQSWGMTLPDESTSSPRLVDNKGRKYRLVGPGADAAPAQELVAGKPILDTLVFEAPAEGVGYLNLELSASAYGKDGVLQLRIPGSRIAFP